ncbi:MBL fold metallo-hydrolase [Aeromicrobium tamlense]|uniref:Linear primary-alkylsulfatase n=1 Tax=Aeromicrobium tamlense TaxID=375541 RepID=A0A8I0KIU4_9ACTN|nr:alkyl sulfatase dimerization domain-containing protein [Aeromicrobium tamlense]MBD1270738.1 MBL fold metallo-hydrolase [Aeromicrobium tamlense]MBD1271130.1 MBL fold metallo-hydrolase [Aeromicrobium tamlense]NYI38130.1 alkyl sulfatase BDS1-like metallo-beta-lactamase superfamily hydrolase [Aeromicrobium tamlense]
MADETPYPFEDTQDFDDARRGHIASLEPGTITNEDGEVVWDCDAYQFLDADAPATANPSLWRQSQLVAMKGLFEVTDGIYQVRGFDLSNITFVEGDSGVIVIDPLISTETAAAALKIYREHRGERDVVAVIYTHCHVDHFGGVKGVTTQEAVDAGEVEVIAPVGFMEPAIAENLYAGTAMGRRAGYMYGAALPRHAGGGIGAGLGQTTSTGTVSLIAPTTEITETGQELTVDGVRIVFQLAPGTEAPAEMHFHFPQRRALCIAENATHTLHNILTIRGAVVRDPNAWAHYLNEARELFGDDSDVVFASHHWPTWGNERVVRFLETHRDLYAYLHGQTLRLLNQGLTGIEIAESFPMPPGLEREWSTHGYYGSVSHNVKAIYQRYMGWYDGNPTRLWQHPPQEAATRYVEFMGGADAVVSKARSSQESGDLRWAAQVLDHVVFADPDHQGAKELLADVLEQLGYQAENGTWRSAFLSGAMELRHGNFGTPTKTASADIMANLTPELFFDALAVKVDGPAAWDLDISLRWDFPDHGSSHRTSLRHGAFTYGKPRAGETVTVLTVPKPALSRLAVGDVDGAREAGLQVDGDVESLVQLFDVLQAPDPGFNIILP